MINPVVILHREDLPRAYRSTPIEHVTVACLPRPDSSFQANDRIAELVLFVGHQDGNGQIKVLKSRRLGAKRGDVFVALPTGTILPSDLFDDLVCERLDLMSPRVIVPEARTTPVKF